MLIIKYIIFALLILFVIAFVWGLCIAAAKENYVENDHDRSF